MNAKQRLSASVDTAVLAAARAAVADGRAANVSAWVNEALHRQAAHDDRMRALDDFLSVYETEHGIIGEDEIRAASRTARAKAVVVRGTKRAVAPGRPRQRRSGAR